MVNAPAFLVILETPAGRREIRCGADEYIWNAAARAGIQLPAICHQGRCLTCAARLIQGDVDNSAAVSYYEEDRRQGFVLLCTAHPKSEVTVETHQAEAMRAWRRAHGLPAPYA
ncbi:MAG TPA: 2Fe-2S iron-sulfur cluster-binding protein [Bryobacteraceae bacterium]|nr:2Fe-2S iron-sulfur cluster-binding protein [Bryobacteraceae bacterium]